MVGKFGQELAYLGGGRGFRIAALKGQRHEIFGFWFCHESVSPKPLSIPLGPFRIFRKFAEIFAAQGSPPVLLTPVANEKNLQSEIFFFFFSFSVFP
jgi:hypothetical protein